MHGQGSGAPEGVVAGLSARLLPGPAYGLILLLGAALVLPLAGLAVLEALAPATRWVSEPVHAVVEGIDGFIAVSLAGLLLLRMRLEPGQQRHPWLWVACGLLTTGLFDAFHAAAPPGQNFVWLHSLAAFSGGLLFSLVLLPPRIARIPALRHLPEGLFAGALTHAAWLLLHPQGAPVMFQTGEFTLPALRLNQAGGVLFWVAALWFALRHARQPTWDDLLFGLLAGMLGTAGLMFEASTLWGVNWWWWHLIRVAAFAMAFVYISATFYRGQIRIQHLNTRLDETNQRLEERLAELATENTERREAERALRESEHRHRLLYNKTPAMLHTLDREGRVVEVSNFWLDRMGFARPEVVGRPIGDFLTPGSRERMAQELDRFFRAGSLRDLELAFVRQDGTVIDALVSAAAEYGDAGDIRRSVMVVTDVTDRKAREAEVEHLSYFDALTHLPNRRLLAERANQAMAQARREGDGCAVIYLDLDRFKDINDTLGHDTGDRLLLAVARRLQGCLREADTLARLGGDEFVFLLPGTDPEAAARVAGRIQLALRDPVEVDGQGFLVTASMGLASFPEHGEDLSELLKHADIAMFQAKSRGLEHLHFRPEQREAVQERVHLEAELRRALADQALAVHFQPQVCLATGRVRGLETLVRWEHPERGAISPGVFIPLAEETGLIHQLGQQVLEAALAQIRQWADAGHEVPRVAVNLSARELQGPEVTARIAETLALYELPGHLLELEVTETAAMTDPASNLHTLDALRQLGVAVAIDDFGTGYSSFSYLERLPVDTLKIDRSFVASIDETAEDHGIIQTILALTRELDLGCVAEGVETSGQAAVLRQVGCLMAQGFWYAPALPAAEIERRFLAGPASRAGNAGSR